MSGHHSPGTPDQEWEPGYHHHAFHSQLGFNPEGMHHFDNKPSMGFYSQENPDFAFMHGLEDEMDMDQNFFDGADDQFKMNMEMFQHPGMSNIDPSHVWHSPDLTPGGFNMAVPAESQSASKSSQSNIVRNRGQVSEQFGQITPPDENTPDSDLPSKDSSEAKRKFQEEDLAKQNRTQRARNAANQRHSKSKTARQDDSHDAGDSDGEKDQSKSTNVQREKNRLAAAKCRAKKKATSEEMQETHRDGSRANGYLLREMRELRDQKAFLRNALLQHAPGLCQCHAIHRFNMAQAQQLAMGVGAMIGQPLSPSEESVSSLLTPDSDESTSRRGGVPTQGGIQRPPSGLAQSSTIHGSSFNIGQLTGPETYPTATMSAADPSIPGNFAEFLHSSPDGSRTAFH